MKKEEILVLFQNYENAVCMIDETECWSARDLQKLFGYSLWQNFTNVIAKAKEACANVGQDVLDHFIDVNKMIIAGKGAQREVEDIMYLKTYTYVKEFGEGVDRMCREMEAQGLRPVKYSQQDFMTLATAYNQSEKKSKSAEIKQKPMIETPNSSFPRFESATFSSAEGRSNGNMMESKSAGIEKESMIQERKSGFSYSISHPTGAESAVFVSTDASRLSVSQMIDMENIRQQLVAANSKKPTIAKINKLCDNIKVNEVFGSKLVTQILNCSETQARAIIKET